ncbi:MAG: 23S rRNA (pseudouridine(1915)-N(3))-methyltransferase RlmH [Clostridia bacterium]
MLNIKIICVGKLKEKYLVDAIKEYEKRLKTMCKLEIIEVSEHKTVDNPNDTQILQCINEESKNICKKIGDREFLIPMCIEGNQVSSEQLAQKFDDVSLQGISKITFIIGGSHGIDNDIKNRANMKLSMSKMTFPHQLARVMLLEQIYRAFSINLGTKYHK